MVLFDPGPLVFSGHGHSWRAEGNLGGRPTNLIRLGNNLLMRLKLGPTKGKKATQYQPFVGAIV
jgi:hypothetical protein